MVGLLADALRSGQPPDDALGVVAGALPGPAAARLAEVVPRLRLGVDPTQVWADLAADPALGPLGRALARAHRTGAPVVPAVERLADELTRSARAEVEDRARAVGVKAAVPLGLCLLPAFVLIGIVPVVAGLLTSLGTLGRAAVHTANRPQPASPGRLSTARSRRGTHRGSGLAEFRVPAAPRPRPRRSSMHRTIRPVRDERGITTAEYAVGTAAGAGLAGLLYKMLTGGFGDKLLKLLYDHVLGLLGIG